MLPLGTPASLPPAGPGGDSTGKLQQLVLFRWHFSAEAWLGMLDQGSDCLLTSCP